MVDWDMNTLHIVRTSISCVQAQYRWLETIITLPKVLRFKYSVTQSPSGFATSKPRYTVSYVQSISKLTFPAFTNSWMTDHFIERFICEHVVDQRRNVIFGSKRRNFRAESIVCSTQHVATGQQMGGYSNWNSDVSMVLSLRLNVENDICKTCVIKTFRQN
jgi:hypothetical protein